MSFLGLESPVEYTGYQIFDPTMAKMILDAQDKYFNAVYADYQQGLEDMKEFKKEYYDFDTPILADQDWYNRNVTGKVRNFINEAYARGIDLTRSPEGRAAIAQMINSINVGKVAKLRSSKQAAEDYIKARGVLQSKGLYSPEMEAFVTGGKSLENWNTLGGDGIWNRTSPVEAASLLDLTYDYYKNRTPRDLTAADFIESNGLSASMYNPRYQYSGYLDSDLLNNAQGAALGIANDPRAAYFKELSRRKVIARGEQPTEEAVNAQFYRDIADTNKWALVNPTKKADEFALDDYRTNNDIKAANAREAIQHKYWELQHGYDLNGDGKVTSDERKKVSTILLSNKKDEESSYLQDQFDKGRHAYITGEAGSSLTAEQLEDDSKKFAKKSFEDTKALRYAASKEDWQKQKNKYLEDKKRRGILDPTALASYREPVKDMTDAVYIRPGDIKRIINSDEMVSRTYGGARRGKERFNTDRSILEETGSDNIKMQFTDETYTAPLRYNQGVRSEQRQRVRLYRDVDVTDSTGNTTTKTEEIPGDWWFLVQAGNYHRGTYTTSGSDVISYAPSGISNIWSDESMGEMEPYDRAVNKKVGRKPIKDYE